MDMEQLKQAWWDRQALVQKWQEKLFDSAYALRDEVIKQLKPNPAKFTDSRSGLELSVVEAFEPGGNRMLYRMSPEALAHLKNEVLRFSIGVYLEQSPGSSRRTLVNVHAAVRASGHRIEWCRWDQGQEDKGRPQSWAPNTDAVAGWIIQAIEMMMTWNPMHDAEFRPGIDLLDDPVLH